MNRALVLFLILLACSAHAEHFAFRARENFETIQFGKGQGTYQGLTSSINFFYEKPYDISYGLILNPGLGSLRSDSSANNPLGIKLRYFELGGDLKYFPHKDHKFFIRNTLVYQHVETKTLLKRTNGIAASLSLGWEFWLFDLFSLAPEVGYKHSRLATEQVSDALVISIGLHFYK